jgi:tryptophanyl-tRNA synthetase
MVVTPWTVVGEIDYNKLIERFGTKPVTPELLERIKMHTGTLHPSLRRGIFYSHRDLDIILDNYEAGNPFVLYTGRGPSGPPHLGHMVPWMFTKHLQDKFGVKLLFQITDDERLLLRQDLDESEIDHWIYVNALEVMALGFDPKNTEFIINIRHARKIYPTALSIAKRITGSTARAIFGFEGDTRGTVIFPRHPGCPLLHRDGEKRKTSSMSHTGRNRPRPILENDKRRSQQAGVPKAGTNTRQDSPGPHWRG